MRYDAMYKFGVGDWVTTVPPYHATTIDGVSIDGSFKLKNIRIPMMVVERMIQQCPGGVQTSYKVRPHFLEIRVANPSTVEPYWQVWAGGELKSFHEIELEKFVDETVKADNEGNGESVTMSDAASNVVLNTTSDAEEKSTEEATS